MDNKKIIITLPTLSVSNSLLNSYTTLKEKLQNTFILFQETGAHIQSTGRHVYSQSMNSLNRGFKKNSKKLFLFVVPAIIAVVLIVVVAQALTAEPRAVNATVAGVKAYTKESKPINKTFTFPLRDDKGKETDNFAYEIRKAELKNEIIVKGQRATSAQGREFLIIELKLKNDLKSGLQINSRDYVRLSVNGNKKDLLAPEVHNDPVEVQAISTKFTRLGFAVNTSDEDYVLIVGEINGDKQEIPLQF